MSHWHNVLGTEDLSKELKHKETEDGSEVDLAKHGRDEVAEEIEVRVSHLHKRIMSAHVIEKDRADR